MSHPDEYVLGQSKSAAERLAIQDAHLAVPSERLLDALTLQPGDRVVELGCGPGSFTKRILSRLGPQGVVIGVDRTRGLLDQARAAMESMGPAKFEPIEDDVTSLGPWLRDATVVVGRAVLHHVPMAEFLIGRLRAALKPGTRVGFLEPDFRSQLPRIAYLQATGRTELAPLAKWAEALNRLYLSRQISPDVGATLAASFTAAGFRDVRGAWVEFPSDDVVIQNMLLVYDEIRDVIDKLGIMTAAEVIEQQRLLRSLPKELLPPVWGVFSATGLA